MDINPNLLKKENNIKNVEIREEFSCFRGPERERGITPNKEERNALNIAKKSLDNSEYLPKII